MGSDKRNRYLKKKKQKAKKNNAAASFFDDLSLFPKISEMLIEVAEPLLEFAAKEGSEEAEEFAFTIAIIAWNISIDPSLRRSLPLPNNVDEADFDSLLSPLIERKLRLFPFENRLITDYSAKIIGNEKIVTVHSVFS